MLGIVRKRMAKNQLLTNAVVKNTDKKSVLGKAARGYQKWTDGTIIKDAIGSLTGSNKTKAKQTTKSKGKK